MLWSKDEAAKYCLFLYSGLLHYDTPHYMNQSIQSGMFVGDFQAMFTLQNTSTRLIAVEDSEILKINREDLMIFLSRNPGLKVLLMDKFMIL